MTRIGITEAGDAGLDFSWLKTHKDYDGVILITKSLSHKFIENALKINCIVHATITGLGGSVYESKVPSLNVSKLMFKELVDKLCPKRVVLRIDPIIPNDKGAAIAINVYEQLHNKFPDEKKTRVRISFLDNYPHVKDRFAKVNIAPLDYPFHAPIKIRKKIAAYFPGAEICGEPGFDCIGCVSENDLDILGIKDYPIIGGWQRNECKCLTYKIEMLKSKRQCPNGCIYCYWK